MVVAYPAIGFFGFNAGPSKYIIDPLGLRDPLLARLPAEEKEDFWIGHFRRKLPRGYVASIKCWKNLIEDPSLHVYYEKIISITRGPIFSCERFVDIYYMNTGKYQYLINQYLADK